MYLTVLVFYIIILSSFFFFKQGREKGEGGAEEESENLKQAHAQPDAWAWSHNPEIMIPEIMRLSWNQDVEA